MNRIVRIFVVASLLITFSCKKDAESLEEKAATSLQENAKVPRTKIEFDKEIHDFGQIDQGEIVETTVNIKNVGDNNLYIVDAHGSCGCTVPSWPRDPIAPGKSAKIEVSFDPNGKSGEQSKIVTVTSNTEPTTSILTITATIIKSN